MLPSIHIYLIPSQKKVRKAERNKHELKQPGLSLLTTPVREEAHYPQGNKQVVAAGEVGQKQGFTCMPRPCDPLGKSSMRQFEIECGSVCYSEFLRDEWNSKCKWRVSFNLRHLIPCWRATLTPCDENSANWIDLSPSGGIQHPRSTVIMGPRRSTMPTTYFLGGSISGSQGPQWT